MGFIADYCSGKGADFPGTGAGRDLWREVFGTDKESGGREKPKPGTSNSFARSASSANSFKLLLKALRSAAPGGWSDDRWEQAARHFVGITYVAIHRQNELLTQAEFQVFKKDKAHPDGKRPVTEDDPPEGGRTARPYDLVKLLENPNREDSFGDWLAQSNLQQDLTGTALTWTVPNSVEQPHPDRLYDGRGYPMEMYNIPTALAIPQPVINPEFPHGFYRVQPVYPYGPFSSYPVPASAVGAPIPGEWMMRVKYPHPILRYDGYSPLTAMRFHVDEVEMMDRSRHTTMRRQINPSAVLNQENVEEAQPLRDEDIDRIRAEFENDFEGPDNAGKLYVASPGSRLDFPFTSPREMDFPQSWAQVVDFVLGGGYGITKPAAGMIEDSSYSTLWATMKQLYWTTLDPKCARHGHRLTRHLGPFFGDDLIVEVRCRRIDDHDINFTKIDKGQAAKCITKNQVLKALDMPVTREPWGEDIAGDPTPYEKEQAAQQREAAQQQAQMEQGGPGQGAAASPEEAPGGVELPPPGFAGENEPEPPEVTESRPRPGRGMAGALGPRMASLDRARAGHKSMYDRVKEACSNGH